VYIYAGYIYTDTNPGYHYLGSPIRDPRDPNSISDWMEEVPPNSSENSHQSFSPDSEVERPPEYDILKNQQSRSQSGHFPGVMHKFTNIKKCFTSWVLNRL
jgi:hypothetical protein